MSLAMAKPVAMVCTADRSASEPFYGETLGFECRPGDEFAAVFALNGMELRLTEVPGFTAGPHPVLGWEVDDIEATIDELAGKGVRMSIFEGLGQDAKGIWTAPDGRAKVAFFADPDGNALTLKQQLK